MEAFNFLSVLLSIILGLAITQVLQGFRGILLGRAKVRLYWPVLVWGIVLLAMFVQSWWAMFGLRRVDAWTFAMFSVVLLQTIISYMLAALVFPDFTGTATIDLRQHYFEHRQWYFGFTIAILLASLGKDLVLDGHLPDALNVEFHVCFIAAAVLAMLVRSEWYHKALPLVTAAALAAYIAILFSRLR